MVNDVRAPLKGGASDDNEEAKKARERLPKHAITDNNPNRGSTPLIS